MVQDAQETTATPLFLTESAKFVDSKGFSFGKGSRKWPSGLSGSRTEWRESGGRIQARWEVADKGFHRRVPEAVKAEEIHLLHRLFWRPLLHSDAVDGGEHAGAIVTEAAVDEDFLPRVVAEEREKLGNLFIAWRRPATDGNVDKAHAQRFGVFAFPKDLFVVFAAQIDDGGDAQYFELRETDFPGLRTAIEEIRDFSSVGNSGDAHFLSVSSLWKGRSRGWRRGLRWRLRKKGKRKKEEEGERAKRAFHFELDARV